MNSVLDADGLLISTPEGISFRYELAGPVSRFLAWCIDVAVILTLLATISVPISLLTSFSRDLQLTAGLLLWFLLPALYGLLFEYFMRGQTPGKRVLGLRVIDEQGLRLQFSQVVVRNLLRFVDGLPVHLYLVGGIACLLTRHAQRLGDVAASTVVVRILKPAQPDLDQLLAGKYNSLRNYPHLEARLRQRVSPREAAVALQALVRREHLQPQARVDVFEELSRHFRSLVPFPPEAEEGVPAEQYVRNVVDVLFRSRRK